MDEEAQKRNTDCVYFLASPLTCKKGNGCEFRHSEAARMNPRDCWYWIHSTCRNPNCSFRHPPVEGKPILTPAPQISGAAVITNPSASTVSMPTTTALSSKSKTPCYFFSQGHCAKGDKCSFMHGSSLPSSIEVTSQQKPPKVPSAEAVPASNNSVVMLKGQSSNAGNQNSQENREKLSTGRDNSLVASAKAPISGQKLPQIVKELERTRVSETSATTNPYRNEKVSGSRKSRAIQLSDTQEDFLNSSSLDRHHNVQAPLEKSKQGQTGRKQQQQHENERPHLRQAVDRRYQNGSRSDVFWKNESSSLDGDGSDESIQREDGEYSPHQGSQGRVKIYDDSTDYSFKASKSYGQGSDSALLQHRQPRYLQDREQQVHEMSDYNGLIEHTRHRGYPSSARTSARDGQRMLSSSNVDLRDHLLKRRRDDAGHYTRSESLLRRDVPDIPHHNHRRDESLTQQGQQGRATHRRAELWGGQRPLHDGGASPDSRSRASPIKRFGAGKSPDRASSMGSPSRYPMIDRSRSEERERERDWYNSKKAPSSDVRSQLKSRSVRSENSKEESGFAGPKSLAQIKAEKMVEVEFDSKVMDGQGHKGKYVGGSEKSVDAGPSAATNNQDSTASTSRLKRSWADSTSTSKRESSFNYNTPTSEDFEGPKPLSLLLKKRQKVEPAESTEGVVLSKKREDLMADLHREMEDGEVREEDGRHSHRIDIPIAPLQEEIASRSRVASDHNNEEALEEGNSQGEDEGHGDVGSSEDEMRLGVEIGEAISGDEDFGLDDDEDDDDFAKKLGGFFS